MTHVFDIVMVPMQFLIFLFTMYFFIISFCGMWRRKEKKITTPRKTFAVVVAAHNEHAVIGQLVTNLQQLNYPKDLYDIYVIADNCSDNTADIAREKGAIVCVRTHPTKKSKGYALEWMFERLFKMDKEYDGVVIFDADNLVHPQFLMEMNNRLCKGDKIIQGYRDEYRPVRLPRRYGHVHRFRCPQKTWLACNVPDGGYGVHHEVPCRRHQDDVGT